MKLLRYGSPGHERPGLLDSQGRIRDLSILVDELTAERVIAGKLEGLAGDRRAVPAGCGWNAKAWDSLCWNRQIHRHRTELQRSCERDEPAGSERADGLPEGHQLFERAVRQHCASQRFDQSRLGG